MKKLICTITFVFFNLLQPTASASSMLQGEVYLGQPNLVDIDTFLADPNSLLAYTFETTSFTSVTGGSTSSWATDIIPNLLGGTNIQNLGVNNPQADWFSNSLMRLTGFIDTSILLGTITATVNDILRLNIGGQDVISHQGVGSGTGTYTGSTGIQAFELIFVNNVGAGGLSFTQNINGVDQALTFTGQANPAVVPIPPSLLLMLSGLGGLATFRRRKNA